MRKKQIVEIFVEQTKRKNTIISLLCLIVIIAILSVSFFVMFAKSNKEIYVTYSEKSNIEYKVFLKENEFFENDYLDTNKQYIASLIDKITANFKYHLAFDSDNVNYKYEYRVEADVNVYDTETNNVIFNKKEEILKEQDFLVSKREVDIKETIDIDYNYYNDLIKKFVSVYDLDDVESVLNINMYVNTIGSCEDFSENEENESVITLMIPLTTKTVAIEISDDLIDTANNVMLCDKNDANYLVLTIGIIILIGDICVTIYLIKYEEKTRSADTIYTKKLQKILNNYGSYIQEIADGFNLKGYQLIKIKTFEDLLEIRDTIKQPILMSQNNENTCTYFIVPSASKYIYIYRLTIEEI